MTQLVRDAGKKKEWKEKGEKRMYSKDKQE